jgi:hypothetical protein
VDVVRSVKLHRVSKELIDLARGVESLSTSQPTGDASCTAAVFSPRWGGVWKAARMTQLQRVH